MGTILGTIEHVRAECESMRDEKIFANPFKRFYSQKHAQSYQPNIVKPTTTAYAGTRHRALSLCMIGDVHAHVFLGMGGGSMASPALARRVKADHSTRLRQVAGRQTPCRTAPRTHIITPAPPRPSAARSPSPRRWRGCLQERGGLARAARRRRAPRPGRRIRRR